MNFKLGITKDKAMLSETLHVPSFLSGHPIGATGLAQCAELNWQVLIMFSPFHRAPHKRTPQKSIPVLNIFPRASFGLKSKDITGC